MRTLIAVIFLLIGGLGTLNMAYADGYPTEETVRFVLGCMIDLGGETDENLYTCICRYDTIRNAITFSDYEEGVTYERNKAMPGEKGGFFRDNSRGKKFHKRLVMIRRDAENACPVTRRVKLKRPAS